MMTYIIIKQILWLREPLGSADVAGAVQAEWARRWTSDTTMTALFVKQNNKKDDNIKTAIAFMSNTRRTVTLPQIALCVNSLRRRRSGG